DAELPARPADLGVPGPAAQATGPGCAGRRLAASVCAALVVAAVKAAGCPGDNARWANPATVGRRDPRPCVDGRRASRLRKCGRGVSDDGTGIQRGRGNQQCAADATKPAPANHAGIVGSQAALLELPQIADRPPPEPQPV